MKDIEFRYDIGNCLRELFNDRNPHIELGKGSEGYNQGNYRVLIPVKHFPFGKYHLLLGIYFPYGRPFSHRNPTRLAVSFPNLIGSLVLFLPAENMHHPLTVSHE